MMINRLYNIDFTSNFKKQYKKLKKQGKDINKLMNIINLLSCNVTLDFKYKNHNLTNSKKFKDCMECHIEPDWLLIYRINNDKLILIETGSHSDLF